MDLRSSNKPEVLNAIRDIFKQSQEKAVQEQQHKEEKTTDKYAAFRPKENIQEALTAKQKKLDKNKNNKLDAEDFEKLRNEEADVKNTDTPGNSTHQCAIHVKHSSLGEGKTLFSQHAEPDTDGNIAWYDVMFEHGIEKRVPTSDLEVVVSESHGNHKKK